MATLISDPDTFALFESLVTDTRSAPVNRPEYVENLRAWRTIECDKTQAEIYRGQERQVHGRAVA